MSTQRKKKKKKKSNRGYLCLALIALIAVAVVVLVVSSGGGKKPAPADNPATLTGNGGDEENPYAEEEDPEASTYKVVREEDKVKVEDLSVTEGLDETWRNILLLGLDVRDFDTSARSDTMIIGSVNTKTGAVKLCSILRDCWVNIPKVGEERINVSYQYGGPQLAIKTVNELFGLNITEYVAVNFSTLPHIIDAIGGVEVNLKPEEVPLINFGVGSSIWHGQKRGYDESDLKNDELPEDAQGYTLLTGRQALAYARIRKIDSDFMRTSRQRTVISAAMTKFRGQTDTMTLLNLANNLVGYVQTNVDTMAMVGLAVPVLRSGVNNISEMRIPINDSYTYENRNFISAFYDIDIEANKQALHQFIYGD